jgi:hypothetical protein
MTEKKEDICTACGVKIVDDVVHFSYGKPGTRQRLHARVCQYAKKEGCINRGITRQELVETDFYLAPSDRGEYPFAGSVDKAFNVLGDA